MGYATPSLTVTRNGLTFFKQKDRRHLQPNLLTRGGGGGDPWGEATGGIGCIAVDGVVYAEGGHVVLGGDE